MTFKNEQILEAILSTKITATTSRPDRKEDTNVLDEAQKDKSQDH